MADLERSKRLDHAPPRMWTGHPGNLLRQAWFRTKDVAKRRAITETWWKNWRAEWVKLEPPTEAFHDGEPDKP